MTNDDRWRELLGHAHAETREPDATRAKILAAANVRRSRPSALSERVWKTAAAVLFVAGLAAGFAIGRAAPRHQSSQDRVASVATERVVWF